MNDISKPSKLPKHGRLQVFECLLITKQII